MPTAKLTKRTIEGFAIPAVRQVIYWDAELKGFGVRVLPSGLKTFVVQYRTIDAIKRRLNLGRFGPLTVEKARGRRL